MPDKSTSTLDINKIVFALPFTNLNYLGCFPRDYIPENIKPNECLIFNNLNSNSQGEHWIAMVGTKTKPLIYDSFGRDNSEFGFDNTYIQSNRNVEQSILDMNCGYRCMVWLCLCDLYGIEFIAGII